MPATRAIRLGAPWRGKQAKTALSDHPKSFVYDSLNFWPYDAATGRDMLSVCPGYEAFGSSLTSVNLIATLNVAADASSQQAYSQQLMIAHAGELYRCTNTGTGAFTQVGGSNIISTGRNVQAASYRTKLYIANDDKIYVYNYSSHTYGALSAEAGFTGTDPAKCRLVATWGSRVVYAGNPEEPYVVRFARVNTPHDLDYTQTDTGAAVAVSNINQEVTCLIAHNKDCLICGTFNACWIFRGNPTNGGTLERFADIVGPVNSTAWCKDGDGYTYMLTHMGLFRMAPGCGTPPVPISMHVIPESLMGLDGVTNKVFMEYDVRFRCVHIYVSGGDSFHYFPPVGDRDPGSFWPVSRPHSSSILAIGRHDPIQTTAKSGVLIGGNGNLCRLDRDEEVSTAAYAKLLFQLGEQGYKGIIRDCPMVFHNSTDDTPGTVALYGAETAEDVVAAPASRGASMTIGAIMANHNRFYSPRVGGTYGMMTVTQSSTSNHIALENATPHVSQIGKERG